ncbi:MAG: hypothetical protein AAF845_11015 [Bacteroidota bacterium]
MLTARPAGRALWSYQIADADGAPVATVELDRMKDTGVLRLGDVRFGFSSPGWRSRRVALTFEGVEVAAAERNPGLFRIAYDIHIQAGLLGAPEAVHLRMESSPANSRFRLRLGDRDLGEIRRRRLLSLDVQIDVSDALPLGVQAFLLALVVIEWRRSTRSA